MALARSGPKSPPDRPSLREGRPIASATTPQPAPPQQPPEGPSRRRGRRLPPAEGRTVRVTVDLPSPDRRALAGVCDLLADELDVHVPAGQVMAALAHLVADDDHKALRDAVAKYLRNRVVQ